jgi:2-amino-4-hydroxy-6-hydroxymethyldihydropteridine diphosphokinase
MHVFRITYLSLGSNLGNKLENLQIATDLIAEKIGIVSKVSRVYKSESWGFDSHDFLNCCLEVRTGLNPEDLLDEIQSIEREMGRERNKEKGYEARSIDIDILLYDDEVIFTPGINVPHKAMLKRKFVLVPLEEIAGQVIHPIEKKRLTICLSQCEDSHEVEAIPEGLIKPTALSELYNYIAIEGNIGAGKTSLTNMIASDYNAKMVLERFADNPFLPKFYQDQERYAFPLEMSFLADRYQQLSDDLAQFDLFKNFIVSDYYIFKSLIFAQVTLQSDEYFLYRKMFDIMYKEIAKPDLYIYLYQTSERLMENIRSRGRDYEKNITAEYLDKIHKGYANFIQTERNLKSLVIDVTDMDFVNNSEDYQAVLTKIKEGI